ncbi:ribonuclease R [Candidatus Synchoanobacter obligatus]|uniref:Ribonuclease R n=1 Tax=Candidatus Synchoanobacter obligatus TaxID=2919597 RepID=A0ABT1L3R2_9GAMM|nr:ribonuclease R [Candidatus Synchoanobacter obligatus]MCP8351784.1 ribonuclease R [Candidatus Synchoanobacter obligatus]
MTQFIVDVAQDEEESKKGHPISSREKIYAALEQPVHFDDLFAALKDPLWAKSAVYKRVAAMVRDQQLIVEQEIVSHACVTKKVVAKVIVKNALLTITIDGVDLPLSERHSQGVFPDDEIVVRVPESVDSRSIPVLVKINTVDAKQLYCVVKYHKHKVRILPFDQRIKQMLVLDKHQSFQEGTVLLVKRHEKQSSKRVLKVTVVNILGDIAENGLERRVARQVYSLSDDWPDDYAITGADQDTIDRVSERRESWEHLPLVTIDGADAKDYDDAVYAEKTDKGYRLYVAIADVSHYVEQGTELDVEAAKRANSVYLPGYVIPMLPEVLSNNACSLLPNVKRLAMGCVVDIDKNGRRVGTRLARVVIKSHARLVYEDVHAMIQKEQDTPDWLQQPLSHLDQLAKCLRERRIADGTIIIRSHETKFGFDTSGTLSSVQEVERVWPHQLIEECMLCANTAVGQLMHQERVPLIYRCHNEPSSEKVEAFQDYLRFHQIQLPDHPTPADLQAVIDQCQGKVDSHAVEMMVLRTLSQAYYCADGVSHFALSTDYYTHFTSPIRRYVDLTVHRAIGAWLDKKPCSDEGLEKVASQCSTNERRADEAGWFTQAWLKAKWMLPSIGKKYSAKVVSVTHFGLFVALKEAPIEGLVHISALGKEFYSYHADTMTLQGKSSGKVYGLGQSLTVRLTTVDLALQRVDFVVD